MPTNLPDPRPKPSFFAKNAIGLVLAFAAIVFLSLGYIGPRMLGPFADEAPANVNISEQRKALPPP